MPTRREFLRDLSGAAAGIVFTGCCCAESAFAVGTRPQQSAAPAAGSRRGKVVINGRRVTVIDVHSHVRVPEAWELVKDRIAREGRYGDMAQGQSG